MSAGPKLMEKAGLILQEKGRAAVDIARRTVLQEEGSCTALRDALRYFIGEWNDVLHPALVSIACEAVGGKPEITHQVSAALVLMAGAADIHDDVIDESFVKEPRQTVLGKFGKDIAILAGDAILFRGLYLLHEACEKLEKSKKNAILDIVNQAFFEISGAEAAEASMRGRIDVSKQEYLDIIRSKVAAGEASAKIGALLGDGSPEQVEILAEYGRTVGILLSLRDEFVDMFEQDELENRAAKEILPLPIVLALADESRKTRLLQLVKGRITDRRIEEILDIVTSSKETMVLLTYMKQLVDEAINIISPLQFCKERLQLLVEASLEDL